MPTRSSPSMAAHPRFPTAPPAPTIRAQTADEPPPPISGGGLAVTERQIIIADLTAIACWL
ncbi:MAG: hypothetical protein R3F43_27090 [bacterium]